MDKEKTYQVSIIGGGLAGLSLAIQFAKAGISVVLFEKEYYPIHRVCGEYISLESWDFLCGLGLPLDKMNLPMISRLKVTAPDGTILEEKLDLGGFGISRYKLDDALMHLAKAAGVTILERTKVNDIVFENERFNIITSGDIFHSLLCFGSFGKKSNLDNKLSRPFVQKRPAKINNLVGVKYHIKYDHPKDQISLHNFQDGYCGISKVEDDISCLCYLTTANNLRLSGNSISSMEENILSKNPELKMILSNAEHMFENPVTISQVSLDKKSPVENHIMMLGDAAGMIAPLCGNGMSMAFHSSKIAFSLSMEYFSHKISLTGLLIKYTKAWNNQFAQRLMTGRFIQSMFGKSWVTNLFIRVLKNLPWLTKQLIKRTHGRPFDIYS